MIDIPTNSTPSTARSATGRSSVARRVTVLLRRSTTPRSRTCGTHHRPGRMQPLVPADQRRSARGRGLPAGRQRGRRDPALRAAAPAAGDLRRETSVVELRLPRDGDSETTLELEHTVPLEIAGRRRRRALRRPRLGWRSDGPRPVPRGEVVGDPVAAASSPEAMEFSQDSVAGLDLGGRGVGHRQPREIAAAVEASLAQFAPGHRREQLIRARTVAGASRHRPCAPCRPGVFSYEPRNSMSASLNCSACDRRQRDAGQLGARPAASGGRPRACRSRPAPRAVRTDRTRAGHR